ncbi:MAG: hypothetical protein K9G38_04335 [Bacteroidales bacterium]|nr:hypothetical protein [Bacteroidales bacterium]
MNGFCYCQNLINENGLWSNTWIGTEHGDNYHSYFIKFEGDTTINDKSYKIIWKSDDILHQFWYRYGAIREDSTKKIYTFNTHNQSGEQLLYDFGIQIGDSLSSLSGPYYIHLCDIRELTFEYTTDTFNYYDFSYWSDCNSIDITWIEGVGSLGGIFNGLTELYQTGSYQYLTCYFEDDILKYYNPIFDTCFPQGFPIGISHKKSENQSIRIFVNQDQIKADFKELNTINARFNLYCLNGTILYTYPLNGENQVIISKRLPPGIYLYSFCNQKILTTGKFIKIK